MPNLYYAKMNNEIWLQAQKLHKVTEFGHYGLPDPMKTVYTGAVLDSTNSIVAYGTVPLLAEAVIVVDSNQSTRARMVAIQMLLDRAITTVHGRLDGLHAFIQDDQFERILTKHFGFTEVIGKALYKSTDLKV